MKYKSFRINVDTKNYYLIVYLLGNSIHVEMNIKIEKIPRYNLLVILSQY